MLKRIVCFLRRKYTKWLLKTHEHTFCDQTVELKYLFIPRKKSRILVVVFSGMDAKQAKYNYVETLIDSPHNRLYILDNFGNERLGCYYLGTNAQNQVENAIYALLSKIQDEHNILQLVFCGSSKGGYAAFNFGLSYPNSVIIAGAPQYYLGNYLTHRKSPELLNIVAGKDYLPSYIEELNRKISDKISTNADRYRGKIYLHFSDHEHTYYEHIQYLISDLDQNHYVYEEERMSYQQHDDVAKYFPRFLRETLSKI